MDEGKKCNTIQRFVDCNIGRFRSRRTESPHASNQPTAAWHNTQTRAGNERSLILDYLRVLAMAGVLVVHCSQQFSVPPQIYNILRSGVFCVQIFFVISGYLACFYFARSEASIANYYKKRAL